MRKYKKPAWLDSNLYFPGNAAMTLVKKLFFMALLPLLIVLAGGALLAFSGRELLLARASSSWPVTPGRIEASSIEEDHRNSGGEATTHYLASIRYEYAVNGTTYHGVRLRFGDSTSTLRADVEGIISRYPPGKEVSVRYLPEQPDVSVLEPGPQGSVYLVPILACVLVLVGLTFPIMVRCSSAYQSAPVA